MRWSHSDSIRGHLPLSLSLSLSVCLFRPPPRKEKETTKLIPFGPFHPSLFISLFFFIFTHSLLPSHFARPSRKGSACLTARGNRPTCCRIKKKKRTHFPKKPNSIKKGLQILLYRLSTLYSVLLLPTTSSIVLLLRVHIQEIDNSFFLFYSLFSFYILLPLGSIGGGLIPNSGLVWIVLYFFISPFQLLFSLSPLLSFILLSSHHI